MKNTTQINSHVSYRGSPLPVEEPTDAEYIAEMTGGTLLPREAINLPGYDLDNLHFSREDRLTAREFHTQGMHVHFEKDLDHSLN